MWVEIFVFSVWETAHSIQYRLTPLCVCYWEIFYNLYNIFFLIFPFPFSFWSAFITDTIASHLTRGATQDRIKQSTLRYLSFISICEYPLLSICSTVCTSFPSPCYYFFFYHAEDRIYFSKKPFALCSWEDGADFSLFLSHRGIITHSPPLFISCTATSLLLIDIYTHTYIYIINVNIPLQTTLQPVLFRSTPCN